MGTEYRYAHTQPDTDAPRLPGPMALIAEGVAIGGHRWYDNAGHEVARFAKLIGRKPDDVADVLAVTSPRVNVTQNAILTASYFDVGDPDRVTPRLIPSVLVSLKHWQAHGVVRGPKVSEFARALKGDPDGIIIDVWVYRALGIVGGLTVERTNAVKRRVRTLATRAGLTPREAQGALWTAARIHYGYAPGSPLRFPENLPRTLAAATMPGYEPSTEVA